MNSKAPGGESDSTPPPDEQLTLSQVLAEEFDKLHHKFEFEPPLALPDSEEAKQAEAKQTEAEKERKEDARRRAIFEAIHALKQKRSALCLSGGGIRSATFCLGVIQGLAQRGLLGRFDYLSTVSGGGYIGSWLTAWIHREGVSRVLNALAKNRNKKLPPEHAPILHLRSYSNYLSPKIGLFSVDTWTLVSIYLRNLFLNWLMFLPLLLAVLLIPRMYTALLLRNFWPNPNMKTALLLRNFWPNPVTPGANPGTSDPATTTGTYLLWGVGLFFAAVALSYFGANRPSLKASPKRGQGTPNDSGGAKETDRNAKEGRADTDTQSNFLLWSMFPLTLAIVLLTIGRAWYLGTNKSLNLVWFGIGGASLYSVSWGVMSLFCLVAPRFRLRIGSSYWSDPSSRLIELVVFFISGALTGGLLWLLSLPEKLGTFSVKDNPELYACLDGPQLLLVVFFTGVLSIGLAGRSITDEDREWWARGGAWMLIVAALWAVLNSLVLYGPRWAEAASVGGASSLLPGVVARGVLVTFGIISGFVTILFGVSAKTPANDRQADKAGRLTTIMDFGLKLAAPVFVLSLIVALSWLTDLLILLIKYVPGWSSRQTAEQWKGETFPVFSHHEIIVNSSFLFLFCFFIVLVSISALAARCISVNEFSLHSMYRNRLIRAYLGASRIPPCTCGEQPCKCAKRPRLPTPRQSRRRPNLFTGFDPADDLRMSELWPNVIKAQADDTGAGETPACEVQEEPGKPPPDSAARKPLHVLNMTWNLVQGKNLAWQHRKATTFTVSPLHCGSYLYGYRRSAYYGGESPDSISLGTAFTISGAAASPNMGYYSSSAITFLMTLFNARLGWWLGNPIRKKYRKSGPRSALRPMVDEALGKTAEDKDYVYLSDGGHFENLGLYEMVLRRCHTIFVIDASSDPDHKFENLGNAIRRIRVDLGVPIEIRDIMKYSDEQATPKTYCAIGDIYYQRVDDAGASNGLLIYIKPMLTRDEPPDVFNYAKANLKFPHESISDQFFSEQQFESYRVLGLHTIEQIFKRDLPADWDFSNLRRDIEKYLKGGGDDGKGTDLCIPIIS